MQIDRSLCTAGDVHRESHPQLARSASEIANGTSRELGRITRGGCCGLYSEYGPHIVLHDRADVLIRTAEIRVVNIGGNQTHTQSVQRDNTR